MAQEITKVKEPDDPNRCQAMVQAGPQAGQCPNTKTAGSDYCINHGGNKALENNINESYRNYNLTKFKAQLERKLTDPDKIKSLREEVGLLRILIEERINRCDDTDDLLLQSSVIADLISRVEKVVVSCQKLDTQLGGMLDKDKAIQLAMEIVQIVSSFVKDESIISQIATKIGEAVQRISTAKPEDKLS